MDMVFGGFLGSVRPETAFYTQLIGGVLRSASNNGARQVTAALQIAPILMQW